MAKRGKTTLGRKLLNIVRRRQNRWMEKLTEIDNGRLVKTVYEDGGE